MSTKDYPRENSFAFLDDIKEQFLKTFSNSEIENAISYSLNDSFKQTLESKLVNSM